MGGFGSIWHWIIVGGLILLLFGGRGKVSDLMGDVAKGIKAFKKGLSDDDKSTTASETAQQSQTLANQQSPQADVRTEAARKVD